MVQVQLKFKIKFLKYYFDSIALEKERLEFPGFGLSRQNSVLLNFGFKILIFQVEVLVQTRIL